MSSSQARWPGSNALSGQGCLSELDVHYGEPRQELLQLPLVILIVNYRYRSSDGHINGARGAVLLVSSLKLVKNFPTPPPGAPPPSSWPSPPLTTRAWWSLTSRLVKNFHTPPSGAPPPSPWPSPPLTMRAWWSLTPGLEKKFPYPTSRSS